MQPVRGAQVLTTAAVSALALFGLAACGDDGDTAADPSGAATSQSAPADPTSEASTPPASDLPACSEVWVAEATLPRTYDGCVDDVGTEVPAKKHPCSFGSNIVEFGTTFYAVPGKQINEVEDLATSQDFKQAKSACQA